MGDGNNKYFFLIMIVRVVNKYIDSLVNENGRKFIRNDEIEEEVLSFYKGFMGFFLSLLLVVY